MKAQLKDMQWFVDNGEY